MLDYPKHFYISSGVGKASSELVAFDNALIDAGISNYNLLRVSSILPIGCIRESAVLAKEGSLIPTAFGTKTSDIPGNVIASAIAVGIPRDEKRVGVIMEYSGNCTAAEAEDRVRGMAAEAMNNHTIECLEILSSSIEAIVDGDGYTAVISSVAMW